MESVLLHCMKTPQKSVQTEPNNSPSLPCLPASQPQRSRRCRSEFSPFKTRRRPPERQSQYNTNETPLIPRFAFNMMMPVLLSLPLLVFLPLPVLAQDIQYTLQHNVTTIYGTWSSGSQNVVTGAGFAQPANMSFIYPKTTGMSYSFTSDGYYEIARYRMNGNGTSPNCITGVMNWCHGTYELVSNGSITMTPFGDGYQQIQDPCAAISNFMETYNDTELYVQWSIYQDPTLGYMLQLYQFDGSPLPPMAQLSTSPNMLPTQALRNVSAASTATKKRSLEQGEILVERSNSGEPRRLGGGGSGVWLSGLVVFVWSIGLGSAFM